MTDYADVEIKADRVYSKQFEDIYFNAQDGIAESQYVFLDGNGLPKQWQRKEKYCIAETGFGTGLNFLVTAHAWLNDPQRSNHLDYYSIEAFPLKFDDLRKIHMRWKNYADLSRTLLTQYPIASNGCHTLAFAHGKIQLHLVLEDVNTALSQYAIQPDCWYLDGFAPAKNPQMWSRGVLQKIGEFSVNGSRLATFTAASAVRLSLTEAGFEVEKRKGYGRKREMIRARKIQTLPQKLRFQDGPWFSLERPPNSVCKQVAIIGAGIAGSQMAYHLAQRGLEVQVFESQKQVATGASGNQVGVLAPKLTAKPSPGESFYVSAFLYQLNQQRLLQQLGHDTGFIQNGLMQLAHNPATVARFAKLAMRKDLPKTLVKIISAEKAAKILNQTIEHPAMLIQEAGALSPGSLCRALLAHRNITTHCSAQIQQITHNEGRPELHLGNGNTFLTDVVVITNGYQAVDFEPDLGIISARGQTSIATLSDIQKLPVTLGHEGYAAGHPGDQTQITFGASYHRGSSNLERNNADTDSNLTVLRQHVPWLASHLTNIKNGHVGVRAATLDRWPIVGPLPDCDFYKKQYADIAYGKQYKTYPKARYKKGVYVLSGLGSRGLTSAAYCANLLSHMILGLNPPAPTQTLHSLHPARFLFRALKRKQDKQ